MGSDWAHSRLRTDSGDWDHRGPVNRALVSCHRRANIVGPVGWVRVHMAGYYSRHLDARTDRPKHRYGCVDWHTGWRKGLVMNCNCYAYCLPNTAIDVSCCVGATLVQGTRGRAYCGLALQSIARPPARGWSHGDF